MGGFFSGQQQQMIPPTAVEKVPGLQNLGQQLVQYFQQLLSGQQRQMPYRGFESVYGGPGGSFPGLYQQQPQQPAPSTSDDQLFQLLKTSLAQNPATGTSTATSPIMGRDNR